MATALSIAWAHAAVAPQSIVAEQNM
jgi:hypothetical protein